MNMKRFLFTAGAVLMIIGVVSPIIGGLFFPVGFTHLRWSRVVIFTGAMMVLLSFYR